VGYLVGVTRDVDQSSLHRVDYVMIKIAAKDISKVPEVAEGAIWTYLYDFYYEREVEWGAPTDKSSFKVGPGKDEVAQPSPKKPKTNGKEHDNLGFQIEVYSFKGKGADVGKHQSG
jgi:hypothetical protein